MTGRTDYLPYDIERERAEEAYEREEEERSWPSVSGPLLPVVSARSYFDNGKWWATVTLSCGHEQAATLADGRVRCDDWVGVLAECERGCGR